MAILELEDSRGKTHSIECVRKAVRLKEGGRREIPFDLRKIGQMLKNTREEKELTLDEVSNALFLKKPVIEAIESGDRDNLPHPVYVKGHVKQYAALLNIADLLEAEMISSENQPSSKVQKVPAARNKRAPIRWGPKKKVVAASAAGVLLVGFLVFQNLPKKAYVAPVAQSVKSNYQTVQASAKTPSVEASAKTPSVEASANRQPVETSPVAAEQREKPVLEPKN